jgi:hypothetical protein
LYYIKPDYTDSKVNVKLYDYIKLRANIFVKFYIANINHHQGLHIRGLRRHRPKQKPADVVIFDHRRLRQKSAAAVIFDRRRRLWQKPAAAAEPPPSPPTTKTRRHCRTAVAAAYDQNLPPPPKNPSPSQIRCCRRTRQKHYDKNCAFFCASGSSGYNDRNHDYGREERRDREGTRGADPSGTQLMITWRRR